MLETLQNHHTSISINGRPLCNLRFADDIDLMGGTKEELQELTDHLTTASSAYGMKASTEKSKILVNSSNKKSADITMNGEVLEEVNHFKYLGSLITKDGTSTKEVNARIGAATSALARLDKIIKSKNISFSTKYKLSYLFSCTVAKLGLSKQTMKKESTPLKINATENYSEYLTLNIRQMILLRCKSH